MVAIAVMKLACRIAAYVVLVLLLLLARMLEAGLLCCSGMYKSCLPYNLLCYS